MSAIFNPYRALGVHSLQKPHLKAVSCGQLFWEQELGCLGGRGVAKGLEAGG
jgi:hypothetical protein